MRILLAGLQDYYSTACFSLFLHLLPLFLSYQSYLSWLKSLHIVDAELQFAELSEVANRNKETLRAAKREANEFRYQVQALNCEVDALKGTVSELHIL